MGRGVVCMAGPSTVIRVEEQYIPEAHAQLLLAIATAAATDDLGQILSNALDRLTAVIPFTGGSIAVLDEDALVIKAAYGRFADEAIGRRVPRNTGPSWQVVTAGRPFHSGDVLTAGARPTSGFRSYLAVPLRWRERTYGLLEVDSTEIDAFTSAHVALLQQVATLLSGPIALAHQVDALKREVTERTRAERRIAVQYTVTRILSEAPTFDDAAPQILRTMLDLLGWDVGAVWRVDDRRDLLTCTRFWSASALNIDAFAHLTQQMTFRRGVGLPGRVWESGQPQWVVELVEDTNFPRLQVAAQAGFHSAFAFPICSHEAVFGIIEFLSQQPQPVDPILLHTTTALGSQIGQFIERRRAEQARRASEQHTGAILQTALDGIISMDYTGQVTEFNPAAERIFGYRRSDAIGRELAALIVPPALRERHHAGLARYLTSGVGAVIGRRIELTAMRADGSEFPVELAITRVPSDGPPIFTGFVRDISERKRTEAAQQFLVKAGNVLASSLDYQTTLWSVAQLVVPTLADWCLIDLLNADGTLEQMAVAHVDPTKEQLARELRRRYPPTIDAAHPIWQVLQTGTPAFESDLGDLALVAPDAPARDMLRDLGAISHMIVPLQARGRTIGAISLVAGPSGRRYTVADLALGEELARRAALAIDNARLYQEAHAAIALRDEFLSIASHELKTPLTTLLGHTQALQRRLARAQTLGERDQRALQTVEEQALRLNKQIGTLLDVSRLELGQFHMNRQPLDLWLLAQAVVAELEPTLMQHTIRLTCSEPVVIVQGDEQRLEQVLHNLLGNAIKYSPNGGPITVYLEQRGDQAWLSVMDQGMGIPEAARAQLFQRFYRASNVHAQHISGMGIGLYLVQEIVMRHGGVVDVQSTEGAGSTFTVRLPVGGS